MIYSVRASSREEMISWWSEISKLTHSTTFTKHGDGGLDGGAPSRSGTISRSTSNVRPGGGSRAKSPEPFQQGALPPYAAPGKAEYTAPDKTEYTEPMATQHISIAATSSVPTALTTGPAHGHGGPPLINDPKSQPLELSRHNTGSTVSLNMADYGQPSEAGTSKTAS